MSVPVYISEAAPPNLRGKGSIINLHYSCTQFLYFITIYTRKKVNWVITEVYGYNTLLVFRNFYSII